MLGTGIGAYGRPRQGVTLSEHAQFSTVINGSSCQGSLETVGPHNIF
jgi:hypothetical protein